MASFVAFLFVVGSFSSPVPPTWPESELMWIYRDTDGTALSRHDFYWYKSENVRVVYGHFYEGPPPNNEDCDQNVCPMGGFANFTSKCTIRYYPNYGDFGIPYKCYSEVWDRTFDYDQEFNNCKIPSNYSYVGTKVINGITCNGFWFIAINYPNPAGNIMWTAIQEEDSMQSPIRMDILHDARYIEFVNTKYPADYFVPYEYSQFCSSIDNGC